MKSVNKITIFGGGTAGWVTALKLQTTFPEFDISIVLPKKFSNIGVGESTQLNLVTMLDESGIDLAEFMDAADCTLKHGIYYTGWKDGQDHYWHPFTDLSNGGFFTIAHEYHELNQQDPKVFPRELYYKRVHRSYDICVEKNQADCLMPFALHIDADKAAQFFRNFLKDKITIIEPEEFDVESNGKEITSLTLDGVQHSADLYVDCSGFSRILIGKIDDVVYDGYEGNVNSALAARIPYNDKELETIPYTRASAHKYGWMWTIPLTSRIGTGLVYNDKFCTEEQALEVFKEFWGDRIKDDEVRRIKFSSNSLKTPWVGNVVSIGLSSGFIEPLEATGISWFILSNDVLRTVLQHRYYDKDVADRFNTGIRQFVEDVQDFIDAHYMLSSRQDTEFWKYQRSRPRSARLLARLENYRKHMPNKNNRVCHLGIWAFNDISWLDILTGYDFKFEDVAKMPHFHPDLDKKYK